MNVSGALASPTATSSRGGASASALIASICRMAKSEILINRLMVRRRSRLTGKNSPAPNLGDHAHTFPECHAAFDLACRFLGLGVVPDGILVAFIADSERVVVGCALPGTHAGMGAGFQQRRIDR